MDNSFNLKIVAVGFKTGSVIGGWVIILKFLIHFQKHLTVNNLENKDKITLSLLGNVLFG